MPDYKSEVILTFNADAGIREDATSLTKKATTKGIKFEIVALGVAPMIEGVVGFDEAASVGFAFMNIVKPWRLYLTGHGDWQNQTIGGWSAKSVAALLKDAALPAVDVVSVNGCSLGRDNGKVWEHRVGSSVDSFGANLHTLLKTVCGVTTVLHARVYDVKTHKTSGIKATGNAPGFGLPTIDLEHQRPFSKVTFKWVDGKQRRYWAYSGDSTAIDEIMSLF